MVELSFPELVRDLKQRREVGDPPPVLLLGAGASIDAGIGAMGALFEFVGRKDFKGFCKYIEPLAEAERYRLLNRFLQTQRPEKPTTGYQALAALCAEAYFDLILTTNLDPLLDDALAHARLWRRDYLLLVNGVLRADRLDLLLMSRSPRLKLLKLHGDLFHRFMAWTPKEMDRFLLDILPQLTAALHGRDMLVIGYSLRDERIRQLALGTGGAVWFLNPNAAPPFLKKHKLARAVIGPNSAFEKVFSALVRNLGLISEPSPKRAAASLRAQKTPPEEMATMDDFLQSVVAIGRPGGIAAATGFLLAEPRVIVTDAFSLKGVIDQTRIEIRLPDGRRFTTRVSHLSNAHPFGPGILEAPPEMKMPGLHLDPRKVKSGLRVRVGVAAGDRVGVSGGAIRATSQSLDISPVGLVKGLTEIDCPVAPGASGAPVVDETMAVRGFIVAGRHDQPPAYMFPASDWANALSRSAAHSSRKRSSPLK